MHPYLRLLLLLSFTIFACVPKDKKLGPKSDIRIRSADLTQKVDTLKEQIAPNPSQLDSDTLTIDRKTAVFYQPNNLQIEVRMKEVDEADFRAGADDYIYYVNMAANYLAEKSLPVLDAKNKKYLKFVLTEKREQVIKLDTLKELWGIYLFDPKKKAYAADMTIIEDECHNYFN